MLVITQKEWDKGEVFWAQPKYPYVALLDLQCYIGQHILNSFPIIPSTIIHHNDVDKSFDEKVGKLSPDFW